ncbi:hypothetical protein M2232_009351 [Bradyrhizobium japonicum]|uniref:hypothetical protein n=1 Tax=Bradyrhizobium japonicum TaxID=375 RepID=UPI001269BE93|nr:hypothetical protein [Bradyrhizobium japonicum]MCW2225819.1 hypothetical protein [Bradyrhizobium japonicum]MCW2341030.1 hypothetical protein [Bradyrhizobium japonicum]
MLAAAARAAQDAARLVHVERRLELGRQLAALRDVTSNNKRFGSLVRKRFDLHDTMFAGEMQRLARLYGDRPDITKKVRNWRVLVAVSSPSLQVPVRRQFETKILAGENATAKSIAA